MKAYFSIIIPFFNSKETLERAVNSVLSQSFSQWELILINDGSSEDLENLIEKFLKDHRVTYLSQENKGVCSARNLGASKAKGEWLLFLDADDQFTFFAFENFYNLILDQGKKKNVIFSSFCKINKRENVVSSTAKIPGSYCFHKDSFLDLGGFDENMKYGENSELFRRAKFRGLKFQITDFVSVNYFESMQGGSKNLINIVSSNQYLLDKYSDHFELNKEEKVIYLQIIGVALLRLGEFEKAGNYFWSCIEINFAKPKFWLRFLLSKFPLLSKRIYPLNGLILK